MQEHHPITLITGASGGIGAELARCAAQEQRRLGLIARNADALAELADELQRDHGITVHTLALDLAKPGAVGEVVEWLATNSLQVEILINNAGFATHGAFAQSDWQAEAGLLQLNMVTLTELSRAVLPSMVERGKGRILNIASTASFLPGPFMATYYASKAFVRSFSEALAEELRGTGVSVTALCPGPTATQFADRAGVGHTRLFSLPTMSAQEVAAIGWRGMMAGRSLVIAGWHNYLQVQVMRLSPGWLLARLARGLQE